MTNDQTIGDEALDATFTVQVRQLVEDFPSVEYTVDDGWKPVIEVEDNGDLWITKVRVTDEVARSTVVAVHARGTWAAVAIQEADGG